MNPVSRELEESEERHMMEVKVYKQKVKHLLYEQENNMAELKAENMVSGWEPGLLLPPRVVRSLASSPPPGQSKGGLGGAAPAGAAPPEGQAGAGGRPTHQG